MHGGRSIGVGTRYWTVCEKRENSDGGRAGEKTSESDRQSEKEKDDLRD
jgi:hypothetical protein